MSRYLKPEHPVHSRTMQEQPLDAERVERTRKLCGDVVLRWWQSRDFYATLYQDGTNGYHRLTVHRTETDTRRDTWRDGITWDELQTVKRQCGFADWWAVEVFPADAEIIGVHALRHLWLCAEVPPFAWTEKAEREHRGLPTDDIPAKTLNQRALS